MAKALAFKRTTQEVVTVDTVNGVVTALGTPVAAAELTSAFPGRSNNLLAIYRGDAFLLYRTNTNGIRLAKLTGGAWVDVVGFGTVTSGSGTLTPTCLWVERERLVAVFALSNSAGIDGCLSRQSTDGVTWPAAVGAVYPGPQQPSVTNGGNSIIWKNVVWVASPAGLNYYDPVADLWGPTFDGGSDGGLVSTFTPVGSFAFWNGDLYFARGGTVPTLYRLDSNWTPSVPVVPPAWNRVTATGLNGVGTVTVGPDSGTICLFVDKTDSLVMIYSGSLGTKMARATVVSFPAFVDVSGTFLPPDLQTAVNLGFSLYVDDRRRVNELQSLLIRDSVANTMKVASWDGSTAVRVRATFTALQLMPADERFGEVRTYLAQQPAVYITSTSQPFPGRKVINYTLIDVGSRPLDIFGEYSIDGDEWHQMTQGDGDDGDEGLASSPTGVAHTFFWDAFVDLDDNLPFVWQRITARIAGV